MGEWKDILPWLKAAGIRAFKTFCQTLAATIATSATFAEVSWGLAFGTAGMAALLSLLTSCAGLPEVELAKEADNDTDNG